MPTQAVGAHVPLPRQTGPHPGAGAQPYPTGTPARPHSGSTSVQAPYGTPTVQRRSSRRRTIALVVALAAIIGGGTAVVLQQQDDRGGVTATPTRTVETTETPGVSDTEGTDDGGLPEGWVRRSDPFGFTVVLPGEDWERVVFDEETQQVDYTPTAASTSCASPPTNPRTTTTRSTTSATSTSRSAGGSSTTSRSS